MLVYLVGEEEVLPVVLLGNKQVQVPLVPKLAELKPEVVELIQEQLGLGLNILFRLVLLVVVEVNNCYHWLVVLVVLQSSYHLAVVVHQNIHHFEIQNIRLAFQNIPHLLTEELNSRQKLVALQR